MACDIKEGAGSVTQRADDPKWVLGVPDHASGRWKQKLVRSPEASQASHWLLNTDKGKALHSFMPPSRKEKTELAQVSLRGVPGLTRASTPLEIQQKICFLEVLDEGRG